MDKTAKLQYVRSVLHQAEERAGVTTTHNRGWQTPEVLSPVLPVLPPGLIRIKGSFSVLLALAGDLLQQDAWVAFVGIPWVGWGCSSLRGANMSRVLHIPDAKGKDKEVLLSLIDGFDVLVVGKTHLTDREERTLGTRARDRGASLLSDSWSKAQISLEVIQGDPRGIEQGNGHLTSTSHAINRGGKVVSSLISDEGLIPERRLVVV